MNNLRPALLASLALATSAFGCAAEVPSESAASTDSAIAGGTVLANSANPYVVRVYVRSDTDTHAHDGLCTGTLIGQNAVLTAAHCALCASPSKSWIMFGNTANNDVDGAYPGTTTGRYYFSAVAMHSYWRDALAHGQATCDTDVSGPNDVAIMYLAKNVPESVAKGLPASQVLMALPSKGYSMAARAVTNFGAGGTSWNSTYEQCGTRRSGAATTEEPVLSQPPVNCNWTGGSFMIGTATAPSAIVPGDSGGPVMMKMNGLDYVIGVHSYGYGGNLPDLAPATFSASNGLFLHQQLLGLLGANFPPLDQDCDGIPDVLDNCPAKANPFQQDGNHDGIGNACQLIIKVPLPVLTPQ